MTQDQLPPDPQDRPIPPDLLAFWLYAKETGADLSEPMQAAETLRAISTDLSEALETLGRVFTVVTKFDDRRDFLIWSTKRNKYWRDSNHGYTSDPKNAKRFPTAIQALEEILLKSLNADPYNAFALVSVDKRGLHLVEGSGSQPTHLHLVEVVGEPEETGPGQIRRWEATGRNMIQQAAHQFSMCPNCIQDFQTCNIDGCKGTKAPGWRGWPVPEEYR